MSETGSGIMAETGTKAVNRTRGRQPLAERELVLMDAYRNAIIENLHYAHEHGTDRPELANWHWPF
jgi:phosphoketolase